MKRSLVAWCLLLGLAGCASQPRTVTVFAAASTQDVVQQIGRDFETQTGTHVTCNFAASSTLARQIEYGAEADLFLSADERWADHLAAKGLVAERHDLLANRLVVVTPAAQSFKLQRLADLTGDDVKRVALALDPVPAGRYARESLKKAGVWEEIKGRVREAGDVRAALMLVARGEAEAGIVYATDAATTDKVRVALQVPAELHTPIRYPLVLVRRAENAREARAFYDFMDGKTAREQFHKAGFQIELATDEHR